jgi:HAD superfamily hydrolase (TIGR01493 family)
MSTLPYAMIKTVAFDLHCTLIEPSNAKDWLDMGLKKLDLTRLPEDEARNVEIEAFLDVVWDKAKLTDPSSARDLDSVSHRKVFLETCKAHCPALTDHDALAGALYETHSDGWSAYEDAVAVVTRLRESNIGVILISNVGFDVRPLLQREGLLHLLNDVVLSCEVGAVKPDRRIFERALEMSACDAKGMLMVGDNVNDDGGAALVGWRTLILPRTKGRIRGLSIVLDVTGC